MDKFYSIFRRHLAMLLCTVLVLSSLGSVSAASATPEDVYVRPLAGGISQVAMSEDHIAVLRSDGTVAATGNNDWNQCNVSGWSRIVKIWVCQGVTVGLTKEGNVVSTCAQLPTWKNIVDIALWRCASPDVVIITGLRKDGTAVSIGANQFGPYPFGGGVCDVSRWSDVTSIAVCNGIFGLTGSGTVLHAGFPVNMMGGSPVSGWKEVKELVVNPLGLFGITDSGTVCAVSDNFGCEKWEDVVQLVTGADNVLYALTADGTVLAGAGSEMDVSAMTGVVTFAAGTQRCIALKPDGSVIFSPEPNFNWTQRNRWNEIEQLLVAPGFTTVAALKKDGSVMCVSLDDPGKSTDCDGWTDIARLFFLANTWVGLKEDGSLICNDPSYDLSKMGSGVKDTRPEEQPLGLLAAGVYHSVYLREDGKVSAAGQTSEGRLKVEGWTDIVALSAYSHTVGLKKDGTVVATGPNSNGQCSVENWADVVDIDAGGNTTVGLTSRGTVLVVGDNQYGQLGLVGRRGIRDVDAGGNTVYGLTDKGTVVCSGSNAYGQCNVDDWSTIAAISAGTNHVVGLRSDGTVVAAGSNEYGQCDVSGWTDIVAVSAGGTHTVGLRANGSLVFAGSNTFGQGKVNGWRNVIAISTGMYHTLAITSTGNILTAGSNSYGQCDLTH